MRTVLIIMALLAAGCAQTTGNWKMNPGKSTHGDSEPFPRSVVMNIDPRSDGEAVTVWRVLEDGRSETESLILRYDGKDHPYPQQELFESFNVRRLPDGTTEVLYKKAGKIVAREVRQFAPDGSQMTIQCGFFSRTGTWLERVLVFEKQRKAEE
jgi:hypothetical protein